MKKINILVIALIMLAFTSTSQAEMKYGVSAGLTKIQASGSEVEGGETNKTDVKNTVVIPSIFAEYKFSDSLSFGLDVIPMSADVRSSAVSETKTETSVSGTVTTVATSRTQKAQAELSNHVTLYTNYTLTEGLYLKAGVAHVTVETNESLGTGSQYDDADIYGGVIGFGTESDNLRIELLYTDYEEISLNSKVARTDVTINNKITADIDTLALKVGYVF